MSRYYAHFLLIAFLTMLISCQSDRQVDQGKDFDLKVRLASEPDNLHPMFSRSADATSIENLMLYPLAEFDPYSLALTPLIIESVPEGEMITEGDQAGMQRYALSIRPEAEWGDGKPITAEDYIFTLKAAFHPKVNAPTWRGFLNEIAFVEVDENDPKKFEVFVNGDNLLSDLVVVNFNIFPKHIYDPNQAMDKISLEELRAAQNVDSLMSAIPELDDFATQFQSVQFLRETVAGAGPYEKVDWTTGESITLQRKEGWWGEKLTNKPTLLQANAKRIIYSFIPDETTALTALKDGSIDIMSAVTGQSFVDLKSDATYEDKLDFYTPSIMQYHYLELNNRNPKLADARVRKALANLLDYDALIENLTAGLAQQTVGPIHPVKPYYNDDIPPIKQDIEAAKSLLNEAGWSDTNGDGTVDKILDGKRTELDLSVIVSQRKEGQQLAQILKQNAAQIGIKINIDTRDGSGIVAAIRSRDFEILPLRSRSNPAIYDPYQTWHSSSDQPGGGNRSGYHDDEVDRIIENIRETNDQTERFRLYQEFQAELAEDQPVVFLYVPLEKIIINEKFKMQPSSRRPGYFENLIELNADD